MWTLSQPSDERIRGFLEEQEGEPFTYPEAGLTRGLPGAGPPAGYDFDHEHVRIGRGRDAWEAACAAVRRWEMFPSPLTRVAYPSGDPPPVTEGTTVAMIVRAFGVWWVNACRIVYVIDERRAGEGLTKRFGFAYGTLPGHVERGEECFLVEWCQDDSVRYDLLAFSRPRARIVRLGYPFARALQARFRRESLAAMRRAVARSPAREEDV
ncbi:MAG: DUF1990 domain-containing protein [Acidobacteriota bacterium]